MPSYDGLVTVRVTRELIVRLEVDATDETDARDKLIHLAQGMTGKQLQEIADTDDESSDEGEEREVIDVFGIDELPRNIDPENYERE